MFKLLTQSKISKARLGEIITAHGKIKTPFFMPDATRGGVRLISSDDTEKSGVVALVVNTLHLYLQPGMKIIKEVGGIHQFMHWSKPLLADSGGYQVFSLAHRKGLGKITDAGVEFRSPIDGSKHLLTPEKSIQTQFDLGVDMMVCLDDCPPNEFKRDDLERSVERTILWAKKCRREYDRQLKIQNSKFKINHRPLLFGVIQGGAELDLRQYCAEELIKLNFDGYGFGARPVDKDGNFLAEVLQYTADLIPADKLRFALGTGTPEDIVRCFNMGWDMFDCVIPTREGRHGRLYKFKNINSKIKMVSKNFKLNSKFYEVININNAKYKNNINSLDSNCACELCQNYSAAYLHHLFKIGEPFGQRLATKHNLNFYSQLMKLLINKS